MQEREAPPQRRGLEDLFITLAERARASSGAVTANDQEAIPAEDSSAPSDDNGAAAQHSDALPSAAQLEEGASFLIPSC